MPTNNNQVNDLIQQATKNLDQMFGLFTTVQKQVNTLSNLVIEETADTAKTLSKGVLATGDKVSGEALRVAQESINDSVKAALPKED